MRPEPIPLQLDQVENAGCEVVEIRVIGGKRGANRLMRPSGKLGKHTGFSDIRLSRGASRQNAATGWPERRPRFGFSRDNRKGTSPTSAGLAEYARSLKRLRHARRPRCANMQRCRVCYRLEHMQIGVTSTCRGRTCNRCSCKHWRMPWSTGRDHICSCCTCKRRLQS